MIRVFCTLIIAAAIVASSWLISNSLVKASGNVSIKMSLDGIDPVNITVPESFAIKHEWSTLPVAFNGTGSATLYTRFFSDDTLRLEHHTGYGSEPVVRIKHGGPGVLNEPVDMKIEHRSPHQGQGLPMRLSIEQR